MPISIFDRLEYIHIMYGYGACDRKLSVRYYKPDFYQRVIMLKWRSQLSHPSVSKGFKAKAN